MITIGPTEFFQICIMAPDTLGLRSSHVRRKLSPLCKVGKMAANSVTIGVFL